MIDFANELQALTYLVNQNILIIVLLSILIGVIGAQLFLTWRG